MSSSLPGSATSLLGRVPRRLEVWAAGAIAVAGAGALLLGMKWEPVARPVAASPAVEPVAAATSAPDHSNRPGSRPGSVHFEPPRDSKPGGVGPRPAASPPATVIPTEVAADPVAQALAGTDMLARLRVADLLLRDGKFHEAEAVLLALLEHPPSDAVEAGAEKIGVLSRLGFIPHSVAADQKLTESLAPARPKAERLTAAEALGRGRGLHPLWEPSLEPVAATDPDPSVRERARIALGRE